MHETFDGDRCTGVAYRHGGENRIAAARGEVVMAAGAIGTPVLLQLSGIGPDDVLRGRGITARQVVPGIGANLQDHLQVRLVYKVRNALTMNTRAASLWGKAAMGVQYAVARKGPLTMAPSQLGASPAAIPASPRPTSNITCSR